MIPKHNHTKAELTVCVGSKVKRAFGSEGWAFSHNKNGIGKVIGTDFERSDCLLLIVQFGRKIYKYSHFELEFLFEGEAT